jgi:TRAP transporter 4TM/12TM fusion protein
VASVGLQVWQQGQPLTADATRLHMALTGSIVILAFIRAQRSVLGWLLHSGALVAFLIATYYFLRVWTRSAPLPGESDWGAWILTPVLTGLVLFYVYRAFGLAFAILGILFVIYAFYAHLFPGVLEGPENTLSWTWSRLGRSMFGDPFVLAAEFVWLLVFWGLMLTAVGAGPAIIWFSRKLAQSTAGGAALGSVLSSALVGSFTGAGAQNVAITGPVTIPAMRRAGYTKEMAAAVEAVASNGAAITPPVLGAVAFVMANLLNIPFILVIVMTLVPASLWYLSTGLHLVAHARKHGLVNAPFVTEAGAAEPSTWLLVRSAAVGVVPVGVLIYMVSVNEALDRAVLFTFFTTAALWLTMRVETRIDVLVDAVRSAAVSASAFSLVLAVLALVTNVISYTALGSRLDELIEVASGGYAIIALGLMVVVAAILAGPLPPVAMYLIMVITFAPVLTRMGVPYQASHFVAFYMGSLGTIVPPIAQSTLIASVIANTDYMRTNWQVLRIAWPLFVLPVLFVAAPELLLVAGGPTDLGVVLPSVGLAVLAYAFAALATVGWLFVTIRPYTRLIATLVPFLVFWAMYTDTTWAGAVAAAAATAVFVRQWALYLAGMRAQGLSPFARGAIAGVSVRAQRGLGLTSAALALILAFAWTVLVASPLAPGKQFQFARGIDGVTDSINVVFLGSIASAVLLAGFFFGLARWRGRPRSSAAAP